MTEKEFVVWMKGFVEACNDDTATPKQWESIKEELKKVGDEKDKIGSVNIPSVWTSTPNNITFTVTSGSSYAIPGTYTLMPPAAFTYTNSENIKQQFYDRPLDHLS